MDVAGLPDEPIERYPDNAAYADWQSLELTQHADEREADYLLRLLNQIRRRIDNRIERYRRMAAVFDGGHNDEYARTFRRLQLLEERDGEILDELIDNLRQRAPRTHDLGIQAHE